MICDMCKVDRDRVTQVGWSNFTGHYCDGCLALGNADGFVECDQCGCKWDRLNAPSLADNVPMCPRCYEANKAAGWIDTCAECEQEFHEDDLERRGPWNMKMCPDC